MNWLQKAIDSGRWWLRRDYENGPGPFPPGNGGGIREGKTKKGGTQPIKGGPHPYVAPQRVVPFRMAPERMEVPRMGEVRARSGIMVGWHTAPPHLSDVLWALGRLPRFAGGTREFYTVLQHSWLVFQLSRGMPHAERQVALLHDAAEMLIGDIPSPMKPASFRPLEKRFVRRLCLSLGIVLLDFDAAWNAVKPLDAHAYRMEAAYLTEDPWEKLLPLPRRERDILEYVLAIPHHPDGPRHGGRLHAMVEKALTGKVSPEFGVW